MDALQKVVWAEGVFLGQQHLQLSEAYAEARQSLLARAQSPFLWGLLRARINPDALKAGQFRLDACQLLFPDGRLVAYDGGHDGPLVRDLHGSAGERVEIYLAMPANQSVGGISGYQDRGRLCGWVARYDEVADIHDPNRVREVLIGRPNLVLLRGDEPREQWVVLKLAELVHLGEGFALVDDYIPSVCQIGAAPALSALLGRICDQLAAKVRILGERRARFGAVADFGPSELGQFLLLTLLRPAQAMLQHLQAHPQLHPERLYRELVRLLAGLAPFRPEGRDDEALPAYAHHDLTATFGRLEALLRAVLAEVVPAPMSGFKLRRESESLYSADGLDSRGLERSSLFLAVLFESDDPGWVSDFARQVKLGAREDIELIVGSAMPGVRLVHTQRPPNRLPIKSGYEYFRVEPKGDFWPRVREHQSLAVFLPGRFGAARLELLSVEE